MSAVLLFHHHIIISVIYFHLNFRVGTKKCQGSRISLNLSNVLRGINIREILQWLEKIWVIDWARSDGEKIEGTQLKVHRDTKLGGASTKIYGTRSIFHFIFYFRIRIK